MSDYIFVCDYCDHHFNDGYYTVSSNPKCVKCGDKNVRRVSKSFHKVDYYDKKAKKIEDWDL